MLSKQQENVLWTLEWLIKNPGKTMVVCSPSQEQAASIVSEMKQQLQNVGKDLIAEPCVIDGKKTNDFRLRLGTSDE